MSRLRDFWDTLVCSLFWHDPADAGDFGLYEGTFCVRCGIELHRCKGSDR